MVAGLALVGTSTAAGPPRVTVIGDSVLTAVQWNAKPLSIFDQGLDLQLKIGVCRTLEGVSCPFNGGRVPTLLDVVDALGPRLGPTVLVEMGYNDPAREFAKRVEDSIAALSTAGVQRILWVNMTEWQQRYIDMNQTLDAAAARHPQLTIIDWGSYSYGHDQWFQGDGIHLVYSGAVAMATLLNSSIKRALATPTSQALSASKAGAMTIPFRRLPMARVGEPYSGRVVAAAGVDPYRFSWRIASGSLPGGLYLLANGRIAGTPRGPGLLTLIVQAADSQGARAARRETLEIEK